MSGDKKLIILRGLPGSGKTEIAKELVRNGIIHSTDDFQIKNGKYIFDPKNLGRYHRLNLIACIKSMEKGISPIIIDNTNVASADCKNYVNAARYYGYSIEIVEVKTPWAFNIDELAKRNTHNVSRETIEDMYQRYEKLDVFNRRLKIML